MERGADAKRSKRKMEMEELHEISKAYYEAGSSEVQKLAHDFFNLMDTNGDKKVNLQQFSTFMKYQSYSQMHNPNFFNELDMDNNGTLDFYEVMMLFYIVKSGRPFCDCCMNFISGVYFACVECFRLPNSLFHLCLECYRDKKSDHKHFGHAQFLDNYTLLQATRNMSLAEATGGVNQNEQWATSSNAIVPVPQSNTHAKSPLPAYTAYYNSRPPYPGHHYFPTAPEPNYSNPSAWHASNVSQYLNPSARAASNMVSSYSHAYVPDQSIYFPGTGYSNPPAWAASNMVSNPSYSHAYLPGMGYSTPTAWPVSNSLSVPNNSNAIIPSPINSNSDDPPANMDKLKVALLAFDAAVTVGVISATMCTIM